MIFTARNLINGKIVSKLRTDFEKNPKTKVTNKIYVTNLFVGLHPEYYSEEKKVTKEIVVKPVSILDRLMKK